MIATIAVIAAIAGKNKSSAIAAMIAIRKSQKGDKLNLKCPITRRQCNQNDSSAIVVIGVSYEP